MQNGPKMMNKNNELSTKQGHIEHLLVFIMPEVWEVDAVGGDEEAVRLTARNLYLPGPATVAEVQDAVVAQWSAGVGRPDIRG